MNLRIKNTKFTIRVLGWLQIAGGVVGYVVVSMMLMSTGNLTGPHLLLFLIGFALFSLSIYSGAKLLSTDKIKPGMVLSFINYGLQVVQWHVLGFGLSYVSGIQLSIGFDSGKAQFHFAVSSSYASAINLNYDQFFLRFNLFAVFILIVLIDIWKEINRPPTEEIVLPLSSLNYDDHTTNDSIGKVA